MLKSLSIQIRELDVMTRAFSHQSSSRPSLSLRFLFAQSRAAHRRHLRQLSDYLRNGRLLRANGGHEHLGAGSAMCNSSSRSSDNLLLDPSNNLPIKIYPRTILGTFHSVVVSAQSLDWSAPTA